MLESGLPGLPGRECKLATLLNRFVHMAPALPIIFIYTEIIIMTNRERRRSTSSLSLSLLRVVGRKKHHLIFVPSLGYFVKFGQYLYSAICYVTFLGVPKSCVQC